MGKQPLGARLDDPTLLACQLSCPSGALAGSPTARG